MNTLAPSFFFYQIFFILAGKKDIHNISIEFEIWPDSTKDRELAALEKNL